MILKRMASTTDSPYKNKVQLKINYFGGATTLSIMTSQQSINCDTQYDDTQYNDTQHNDSQHDDTKPNNLSIDTQPNDTFVNILYLKNDKFINRFQDKTQT